MKSKSSLAEVGGCYEGRLREMGTSWEGKKRDGVNILGWRSSVRNLVSLRRLGAAVNC